MLWIWIGFIALVLLFLALDLGVFHRHAHVVSFKESLAWTFIWFTMGMCFAVFVYHGYSNHWMGMGQSSDGVTPLDLMAITADNPLGELDGPTATIKYITGYVIEKSLSVDNIFVIAMIFSFMGVPALYQHRVLFWGVLGALVMRGAMIAAGAALVKEFHWVLYLFAGFLVLTAIKMLLVQDGDPDPSKNFILRTCRKWLPVTDRYHGQHFFVKAGSAASHTSAVPDGPMIEDEAVRAMELRKPGALMVTPLFLALVLVEFTDLIFAVDSIPAIFAITTDPFLVFTSNVFAILGLRSLFFALAGMLRMFRFLKPALAIVLLVVGLKMFLHTQLKVWLGEYFNLYLLAVVALILTAGVVASLLFAERETKDLSNP